MGVIVTAGITANALGVIRAFGRRGIPVVYLDSEPHSIVRYSRYIGERLRCPSAAESQTGFVNALLEYGRHMDREMVIVPAGDTEVLTLSKYREELQQFYRLPVPAFEIVHKLVNKRHFYRLLGEMGTPHPKTYFPDSLAELRSIGREVPRPFIIKPAYSAPFQTAFGKKSFLVRTAHDLDRVVDQLRGKDLEVLVQEVVPGRARYAFYTYLNRESQALAVCGYDKIRHYPPALGFGCFCESNWRRSAIDPAIELLQGIGYHGFAEPELIMDPRDGEYKLLEINARTTLQNRLAAACGVDMEYLAFLDASGSPTRDLMPSRRNVLWVDDFADSLSFIIHLKRRDLAISEVLKSFKPGKVHSVAAWDDLAPFIVRGVGLSFRALRLLFGRAG